MTRLTTLANPSRFRRALRATEATEDKVLPPNEILDGRLWIGGAPVDYSWARRRGIDVVVDVSDPDMQPRPDEVRDIDYRKCPLADHDELPDIEQVEELVGHVVDSVRAGRRVLVHCSFGKNRSGLVVTLAVRELLGVTGAKAVALVRSRRHRAVNNQTFAAYVEALPAPDGTTAA